MAASDATKKLRVLRTKYLTPRCKMINIESVETQWHGGPHVSQVRDWWRTWQDTMHEPPVWWCVSRAYRVETSCYRFAALYCLITHAEQIKTSLSKQINRVKTDNTWQHRKVWGGSPWKTPGTPWNAWKLRDIQTASQNPIFSQSRLKPYVVWIVTNHMRSDFCKTD